MSSTTKRTRTKSYGTRLAKARRRNLVRATGSWDPWSNETSAFVPVDGTQVTESESHPEFKQKFGFKGDIGGDFFTSRQHASSIKTRPGIVMETVFSSGTYSRRQYVNETLRTPVETVSGKAKWPTFLHSPKGDLEAMGATAVSRCSPTNASSDLLVAIGELFKDGLPAKNSHQNWQQRTQYARSAGSEYLNQQFGWRPLLNDILSFGNTVRNADKILSQYERDVGRLVRRRYEFPSTSDSESSTILSSSKAPDGQLISVSGADNVLTPGVWARVERKRYKRWFSGAFSYGVPLGSTAREGSASLAAKADKLFGISLTPDVLWELTPWSWVIDWFSNTGDILNNLSDLVSQGLVMQYGYIMEHTIHEMQYSLTGLAYGGKPFNVPPVTLVSETKQRVRANPFGFGVSWDGLSPFQLSIAAALGISRS